jgi:hypothetical protein
LQNEHEVRSAASSLKIAISPQRDCACVLNPSQFKYLIPIIKDTPGFQRMQAKSKNCVCARVLGVEVLPKENAVDFIPAETN